MTRSVVHMLRVAAARLKSDCANPKLIADLETAAERMEQRKAEGRGLTDKDVARIKRQREVFYTARSMVVVKELMLQRAYDLMWDGDTAGCDAVIEFLPEKDVEEMFEAWEADQNGNAPFSRFYDGGNA